MKKFYFLLLGFITLNAFSQGSINFDDSAKWTQGALAFTSYSNHSYTDGVFTATCVDVVRNTTPVQDGFAGAFGTYSLRMQNDASTEVNITIASGGVGNFSFKARRWDSSPAVDFNVEYSTNGGTNWTLSSVINSTVTIDSDWKNILGTINSANTNILIRIKSNTAGERLMIDDFSWTLPSTDPSIIISSPSNGTSYNPETTNVNVGLSIANFNVANGTGDGHINYTINSGTPIMKYDTAPIAVPTIPGNYTIYAELVDNSNVAIVPAKNATVTFTVASYTNAANLAAVRAAGLNAWVNFTGEALVSFSRPLSGGRNQKYIQDATAGILVDDSAGLITTSFVTGDGISGIKGQLLNFNGVMEFTPNQNATKSSSGNVITPEVVTLATLAANIDAYESKLVRINGLTFATGDGTATFAVNTDYVINDPTASVFRTLFPATEVDYIGSLIPQGSKNITVLVSETSGVLKVAARSLADTNLSIKQNSISGLSVYPNPVTKGTLYITSNSTSVKSVAIFDILGKQVLNAKTSNNVVNVANLKGGVYIVKISEEGKTDTKKLVIE